jgi:hypothetical protein
MAKYQIQRLSRWFYLGSMVGGIIGGIVLIIVAITLLVLSGILSNFIINLTYAGTQAIVTCSLLLLFGLAAILYGASIWYLLLYKAWAVIQDGKASTTPEKAVGYIFIPFYDFYWVFRAWYGLARDYNRYVARYGFKTPKMREGLFLAFCILSICSAALSIPTPYIQITFLGSLVGLASLVIFIITSNEAIDGANALLDLQKEPGKPN